MPLVRGDGSPLTGKSEPVKHIEGKYDKNTRLKPKNRREIGVVPKSLITETGKTRVGKKQAEYKNAVKTWRMKSPFRKWRLSNNLTIQEAADALGVANITYQQWEYGRYKINITVSVKGQRVRFSESLAQIVGFTRAVHNEWVRSKPEFDARAKTIKGKKDG